ncbi:unnamed protein product, partial [Cylicocyclus nassatus]
VENQWLGKRIIFFNPGTSSNFHFVIALEARCSSPQYDFSEELDAHTEMVATMSMLVSLRDRILWPEQQRCRNTGVPSEEIDLDDLQKWSILIKMIRRTRFGRSSNIITHRSRKVRCIVIIGLSYRGLPLSALTLPQ